MTIGEGVTSIGYAAFAECSGLTSVEIPAGVTSIEQNAFYNCSGLTNVEIPDSVTNIGAYAFYNCSGLTSVEIPASVTSIEGGAFSGCSGLTSVEIPASVTSIEYSAFQNCSSLTGVYISDVAAWCAIEFGDNPLFYAHNLYLNGELVTELVIPEGVTSIGGYAFPGCSLTSIEIPAGVTSIGYRAFAGCSNLTEINYNAKEVTDFSYSDYIFSGVGTNGDGITVIFGDSVTSIPAYLFYTPEEWGNPSNIVSVTIGEGVTSIGANAFRDCSNLTEINYNAKEVTGSVSGVFSDVGTNGGGITVIFGDSVTSIPAYIFMRNENIISVTIGEGVTSIENGAFEGCYKLIEVKNLSGLDLVPGSSSNGCVAYYARNVYTETSGSSHLVTSGDYVFYNDEGTYYLMSYTGNSVNLVLLDSINGNNYQIYQYAFSGRNDLTSVTIGEGVTSIGAYAFSDCSGLTSVEIPDSVTSIEYGAFQNCSSLTSAIFENPNGWSVDGTSLASSNLSDPATAARYLTSVYSGISWKRN